MNSPSTTVFAHKIEFKESTGRPALLITEKDYSEITREIRNRAEFITLVDKNGKDFMIQRWDIRGIQPLPKNYGQGETYWYLDRNLIDSKIVLAHGKEREVFKLKKFRVDSSGETLVKEGYGYYTDTGWIWTESRRIEPAYKAMPVARDSPAPEIASDELPF